MSTDVNPVHWRGVHHLALVTTDMDATVRFYHGVLGARLVVTLATDAFRHYFFEVAPGSSVAFFDSGTNSGSRASLRGTTAAVSPSSTRRAKRSLA